MKELVSRTKSNPSQPFPGQGIQGEQGGTPMKVGPLPTIEDMSIFLLNPSFWIYLIDSGNMGGMQREFQEGEPGMRESPQLMGQMGHPHMQYSPMGYQGSEQLPGMQPQGHSPQAAQFGQLKLPPGAELLDANEKKLLKQIMELRQKKDPRYDRMIMDILKKNPKIKDYIYNQKKAS
jgi:hypothetical protein